MESVDLVLSGSGTLLPCHVGAVAALEDSGFKVRRFAGTSGGAIVAAGLAHGLTPDKMLELCRSFLDKRLLQRNLWPPSGWGLHKTERIRKVLSGVLPGRMGDAPNPLALFAVDIETQAAVLFNREKFPAAPVADVAMASAAIPGFFTVVKIPTAPGIFVDGGTRANFALKVWDDMPKRRTIGVRFRATPKRRKVRNTVEYLSAVLGTLIDNANHTYVSQKAYANVIEVDSKGDGLDFDLSDEDIQARYDEGYDAASKWAAVNPPRQILE